MMLYARGELPNREYQYTDEWPTGEGWELIWVEGEDTDGVEIEHKVVEAEQPIVRSNHELPYRAMDFNVPVVLFDETHAFLARERLKLRFPDEWEYLHRQALIITRVSPLSYEQAVDHIIRRERITLSMPRGYGKKSVDEAIAEFGRAWQRVVDELKTCLEAIFGGPAKEWARKLQDAGLIEDPGPSDPKERALWARQHRNTGPSRPSGQNAHAPRRHR